mmetsp:Transcript_31949/g.36467  ORF Transcript_31949/g.36467 Transcript_31949/m.36467 type:complete len:208 (-) Transcript_31949:115-738(-)
MSPSKGTWTLSRLGLLYLFLPITKRDNLTSRRRTLAKPRLTKDDYGSEESEESKTPHQRKRKRNANRSNYSQEITGVLMEWFEQNVENPYPNEVDRIRMCKATGLSRKQLRVWLINARKRKLEKTKTKNVKRREVKEAKKGKRVTEWVEDGEGSQDDANPVNIQLLPLFQHKKLTMIELYQSYQTLLNDEYLLKMFYFSSLVKKFCL